MTRRPVATSASKIPGRTQLPVWSDANPCSEQHVGTLAGNRVRDLAAVERLEVLERRSAHGTGLRSPRGSRGSRGRHARPARRTRGRLRRRAARRAGSEPRSPRCSATRRDAVVAAARRRASGTVMRASRSDTSCRGPRPQLFGLAAELLRGLVASAAARGHHLGEPAVGGMRREPVGVEARVEQSDADLGPRSPRAASASSATDTTRRPRRPATCNTTPAARPGRARSPRAPARPSRRSSRRPPGTAPSRPRRAARSHRPRSRPSSTGPGGISVRPRPR